MPGLIDILQAAQTQGAESTRGPQPGRVASYSASSHSADVDPLVQRPEDTSAPPRLRGVPVLWPWGLEGTLEAGDLVLLIPCERDLSRWAQERTTQGQAPSSRKASLADCVALPVWTPDSAEALALASVCDSNFKALSDWAILVSAALAPPITPPILAPSTGGSIHGKP